MELSDKHIATLPSRTRAILAEARGKTGMRQIYSLALASQMLREQLDAVDHQLQALLPQGVASRQSVEGSSVPQELINAIEAIATQLAHGDNRIE